MRHKRLPNNAKNTETRLSKARKTSVLVVCEHLKAASKDAKVSVFLFWVRFQLLD